MRPMGDLIRYLDRYFGVQVWLPASDLTGNTVVSEIDAQVRELSLMNGLINSQFWYGAFPQISAVDENRARIRLPGTGRHWLETEIVTDSPLPNADLGVGFAIDLVASSVAPDPQLDIDVELSWGSDIVFFFLSPAALIAKRIAEETAELIIPGQIEDELRQKLSGLQTYRYDRSHDLAWSGQTTSPITGLFSAGYAGSEDPTVRGYIDILLVADGYTESNIRHFNTFADRTRNHFVGTVQAAVSSVPPFSAFSRAIRIWKMPLIVGDTTDSLQRLVIPVKTMDRNTLNFSNLARLAEVGLTARDFFGRDPIMVFASRTSASDRRTAGMSATDDIRANTQGPYVLLNLPESYGRNQNQAAVAADGDVSVLVHELGHTPLGHYLADEYGDSGKVYRGLEPEPRNVSKNPLVAWSKWQPWSESLFPFHAEEGAYEHDKGILRFQQNCRMRTTRSGHFCPVCREELTLGLLEFGHYTAGSRGVRGMIDLEVEYLSPWTESQPRRLHLDGGSVERLDVFGGGGGIVPGTRVKLSVTGSSVPEAWRVAISGGGAASSGLPIGQLEVRPGTNVEVAVRYDPIPSSTLLGSVRPMPETSARLVFDRERRVTANNLLPPTDLVQSVPLGTVLAPVIDQTTGRLSLPQEVWLAANLGAVEGFDMPCSVEFALDGPGNFALNHRSSVGAQSQQRLWRLEPMLPTGHYVWSARTIWGGLAGVWAQAPRGASGYCFEIGAIPFDLNPRPPADVFDLTLVETATFPQLPVGLQASSWHPNDRPIKLQFQLKPQGTLWTGQGLVELETSFLSRNLRNVDTVAVTGWVPFDLLPRPGSSGDFYEWRARAIDDQGQTSLWVDGRMFAIYMLTQRPKTLEELATILERLQPGLLNPGGPSSIPRLYVAEQWPTGEKIDLSRLKEWRR